MPAPTSWLTFLHLFAPCFTSPGQLLFEQLVTAWALCPGRRTLTRLWSVMPPERRRRYGAYARWVREGKWSPDELWRRLVVHLVERMAVGGLEKHIEYLLQEVASRTLRAVAVLHQRPWPAGERDAS